ncbi:hypothetical protein PEBR_39148 [Penicillium brasilianum]|uniref:Elongation of fatty acids protein n=1 Tax=Penicillium brasilianum TaxID=104259 RepID=A0A1S9RAV5_PENBI|nr:hypothetical protein PEBR_39148 [Penicillium brasilianum]
MDIPSTHSPIKFGFPSLKLFTLPPSQPYKPTPRPPPTTSPNVLAKSLFQRINIDPGLFYASLDIKFVLTFTALYVTTVLYLNQYNVSRQYRPWRFTKTSTFKVLVVAHNAFLALFSAWTFFSLFTILFPVWDLAVAEAGPNYYAHVAELLCETDSSAYRVLPISKSLWEAGGSYVGWLFYVSKFYEVIDTLIILARGKKSSTLQTYHHAGVIICGWATVLYESPLGAIGVVLNSAIHTLMYTYFTLQTLGISVPVSFKRTLTKLQLAQFFIGWIWGYTYLFMSYRVPIDVTAKDINNGSTPALKEGISTSENAISCLSDSGEAFTIIVTSIYIIPLIYLFAQFYIKAYMRQGK